MAPRKKRNNFEILPDGKTVKIELTQGKFGFCDLEDWEYLKEFSWYACNGKVYIPYYIVSNCGKCVVKMHRLILKILSPKLVVNHIDFDGLNCRKII